MLHPACKPHYRLNRRPLFVITARLSALLSAFIFAATPTAAADTRAARPVLTSAVILGSTAYTPTELFVAYRDRLGQPITRENARAIVTALEELYAHGGYARPELQVQDDLVARGILRINVFESQIAGVEIKGDAGPYREKLERLAA